MTGSEWWRQDPNAEMYTLEAGYFGGGHGEHPEPTQGEHPSAPTHGVRQRHTLSRDAAVMLATARRRRGWSLRQAAARVGVAFGYVAMLEAGKRAPSRVVADHLVDAYQLDEADAALLRREAVSGVGYDSHQRWKR